MRVRVEQSIIPPVMPCVQDFRLSLVSGDPIPSSDIVSATTLYAVPAIGDRISLFDGTYWDSLVSTEFSIDMSTVHGGSAASASSVYAIYAYIDSSVPKLEVEKWTNVTTRATAVVQQDGVWVKSGDATRRHLGDVYITSIAGQMEDSETLRGVWNRNNQAMRGLCICPAYNDGSDQATYTTQSITWVKANAGTGSDVGFIIGSAESIKFNCNGLCANNTATKRSRLGIGLDGITDVRGATYGFKSIDYQPMAFSGDTPVVEGYHTLSLLISVNDAGSTGTWAADAPRYGASADEYLTWISSFIMG